MSRLTPALMRAFDILEILADTPEGVTAGPIMERSGLPRTSVHELLNTLVHRGYVSRNEQDGRYSLGTTLVRLGIRAEGQWDIRALARKFCRSTSTHCGETVSFAVLEDLSVVYIARTESPHMVRLSATLGGTLPANCTAPGKAILSRRPADLAAFLENGSLKKLTSNSIDSKEVFTQEISTALDRGYAFDRGEVYEDVTCVASPVLDNAGEAVGALSIAVPTSRWSTRTDEEWASYAIAGAREMSEELGYNRMALDGRRASAQ